MILKISMQYSIRTYVVSQEAQAQLMQTYILFLWEITVLGIKGTVSL